MVDALRDIAIAAPAAFLGGLIVGMVIRSRYTLIRKNGEEK
jgi:hypothetical protein